MKYDVRTMSRDELKTLQNAVNTRLSNMHYEDIGDKKQAFLTSPEALKLAQRLKALRAQCETFVGKKAKIKLEVELEMSFAMAEDDTELFGNSSVGAGTAPNDVFDYKVTGKVLNAKDFHKDIQSQLQDSLDNILDELCTEGFKLDLATFEDMENFLEEVNELNNTLYDYEDRFELTTDDLDDLLKPKKKTAKKAAKKAKK